MVAATHLPDLNGYQLSSLIKSTERTHRLPIILLAGDAAKEEEFWNLAALADVIYSTHETESKTEDVIAKEIKTNCRRGESRKAGNLHSPRICSCLCMTVLTGSSENQASYFGSDRQPLANRTSRGTRLTRNLSQRGRAQNSICRSILWHDRTGVQAQICSAS